MDSKVWFVTGASKGLGLSLVKKLLKEGERVAATSRTGPSLVEAVGAPLSGQFLPLQTDLMDEDSIAAALRATKDHFGKIDIVVNNAGYGIGGALEELSSREIEEGFQVNLFATMRVIQKALPYLRTQRSGHIINISSIAGFAPGMGWSVYSAAKFAVTGLSESLALELAPLGIKVTVIAPGAFRTQFLTRESLGLAAKGIDDYEPMREARDKFLLMDGNQAGDPDKAAEAILKVARHSDPPVHLFLGADAYKRAYTKIGQLAEQIELWKCTTVSTDFKEEVNA